MTYIVCRPIENNEHLKKCWQRLKICDKNGDLETEKTKDWPVKKERIVSEGEWEKNKQKNKRVEEDAETKRVKKERIVSEGEWEKKQKNKRVEEDDETKRVKKENCKMLEKGKRKKLKMEALTIERFGLVSLFNSISTIVAYLMLKPSL